VTARSKKQDNRDCTRWEYEPSSPELAGRPWGSYVRIEACIDKGGDLAEVVVVSHKDIATTFSFHKAQDSPGDFSPSQACIGRSCPGNGEVALTVYRLSSKSSPVTLKNRNAGDALAGLDLLCKPGKLGANQSGSKVTKYVMAVNSSWGPYQPCRYHQKEGRNICMKPDRTSVGREIGLGFDRPKKAGTGQCYHSKTVGFWFSFPEEGECGPSQDIGASGCSWRRLAALHSADAECLAETACNGKAETYDDALTRLDSAFSACPDLHHDDI